MLTVEAVLLRSTLGLTTVAAATLEMQHRCFPVFEGIVSNLHRANLLFAHKLRMCELVPLHPTLHISAGLALTHRLIDVALHIELTQRLLLAAAATDLFLRRIVQSCTHLLHLTE